MYDKFTKLKPSLQRLTWSSLDEKCLWQISMDLGLHTIGLQPVYGSNGGASKVRKKSLSFERLSLRY